MRNFTVLKQILETNQTEHKIFTFKRYIASCPSELISGKAFGQVNVFNRFFTIGPLLIFRHIEYHIGFSLSSSKRLGVTEKVLEEL